MGFTTLWIVNLAVLLPAKLRRPYDRGQRLMCVPLKLRVKAEALLYEIGRTVLEEYGCLEE